jgi:hypothetical protein
MGKCVKKNKYQRVAAVVMVLTHDKEVARKLTIFCEFLKNGNAVVLARLCNKNECVVASSIVHSFNLFRSTPGSTLTYTYLLRKNLALPGFLYFFEYSLIPVFETVL